jgi:uncharacterized protein
MQFLDIQQQFMDYIRDPSRPLPQGVDARRMGIYRSLFFNNIEGFVSNAFPVLRSLYEDEEWQALVQDFFANHDCHTPIFIEIAGEFLSFLQTEHEPGSADAPFLLELAHYEWLELLVASTVEAGNQAPLAREELHSQSLCLAQTARIAQYSFEVQRIGRDYRPTAPAPEPQFFCVYRDADEEVSFLHLNPLSAQVLAFIEQRQGLRLPELFEWLAAHHQQWDADTLRHGCLELLQQMAQKGVIKKRLE